MRYKPSAVSWDSGDGSRRSTSNNATWNVVVAAAARLLAGETPLKVADYAGMASGVESNSLGVVNASFVFCLGGLTTGNSIIRPKQH